MYGDDVASLQARLQDLGFYTGLVDGHFGLHTADIKGITYNPLTKHFGLSGDTDVNYMLACRREA